MLSLTTETAALVLRGAALLGEVEMMAYATPALLRGDETAAGSVTLCDWLLGVCTWLTVLLAVGRAGLGFLMLTTVAFWKVGGCLDGWSLHGEIGRLSGIRVFGLTYKQRARRYEAQPHTVMNTHGTHALSQQNLCLPQPRNRSI